MSAENPEDSRDKTIEPEKPPEVATDMELALFLAGHIDNPCEVQASENKRENIRDFYLGEARAALPKMTSEDARAILEAKIRKYEK